MILAEYFPQNGPLHFQANKIPVITFFFFWGGGGGGGVKVD